MGLFALLEPFRLVSPMPPACPNRTSRVSRLLTRRLGRGLVLTALLGVACARAPEPPVRIGILIYPGYEPAYLARTLGYLDSTKVRLVDFSSSADVTRAMQNGLIDGTMLTIFSGFRLLETDSTVRAIMVPLYTNGADAIVGAPGTRSLADLRGRRVTTNPSASAMFFLMRALGSVGMTLDDVTMTPLDEEEQEQAVLTGRVASVQAYEPMLSRILAGGGVKLFDTSQMPGEATDVLLVRGNAIPEHRAALQHYVDAWYRARDVMLSDPARFADLVAPREHVSPAAFRQMLTGIEFPDRATGARLLADTMSVLHQTVRTYGPQLVKYGVLQERPHLTRLVDTSFVHTPR